MDALNTGLPAATDTGKNPTPRKAKSPPTPPNIIKNAGSRGSRGSRPPKPAELRHSNGVDHGTPNGFPRGSTGSGPHPKTAEISQSKVDPASPADPFAAVTGEDRARASEILSRGGGTADEGDDGELTMLPCPVAVPAPSYFRFGELPVPSRIWVYKTADGAPVMIAARYDFTAPDGTMTKDVLPWTHGRRVWTDRRGKHQDRTGWHCKAPPTPRPLYGLDRLTAHPDAPVMVCEGEKSVDAVPALFPEFVAVTSQGGGKAASKSDWSPLAGKRVTTWPDRDQAGLAYAAQVDALARRASAASVHTVEVPANWPEAWDLADALPDGVLPARLRELLDDAQDGAAPELPSGFRMAPTGLFFIPEPTSNNPDPSPLFVTAQFRVVGETRTDAGEAWGLFLRWRDREGRPHQWAIPRRMIHRPGNEIAEELEHAGLSCGSDARAHDLLKRFVGGVKMARLLRCVPRTGWHMTEGAPVFVLPGGEAFGRGASDVILQADHASTDAAFCTAGTLDGWRCKVAALAVGNDRLVLFMSAAFAGPLLDVLGDPSGGLHLVGDSRTGKSTAAVLAASVWGLPTAEGQMRTWRGTANGLEGIATETADALLILDEMGQADPREIGDVVYMLANEAGKQRASRAGSARRRQSWRTLFLSTGEVTLAQKMGEAGKRAMAGLEMRLVNIPADAGEGYGIFQKLHSRSGAGDLAEELRDAARAHHGIPARLFLDRLAQDRATNPDALREDLDAMRARFLADHVPVDAAGQVRSVAGRFALIGAAGELARDYGVLPWPEGEALRAAAACFAAWLAERGSTGSGEDDAALAQVQAFLEAHGESRFTLLSSSSPGGEQAAPDVARTVNRAGFRRRVGALEDERWEYLILPETWKAEVCKGLNAKKTANLLATRKLLTGGTERHRAALVTIPGEGKRRVYTLSGDILGGADA